MDDVANGEMERMFLPPMDPMGLLRAVMFGEDDLLRISLDKDDMMMMNIMFHNVYDIVAFVLVCAASLLTSLSMISFQDLLS